MNVKKLSIAILFGIYLTLPLITLAQNKAAFDRGTYISRNDTLPYRILFPHQFDSAKKYAVIFVLHGSGERGNNNEWQLAYGTELFLKDTIRQRYQAIVVYPQCPAKSYWSNVKIDTNAAGKRIFVFQENGVPTHAMVSLMGLVDQLLDKPYVNKKQVYIGGLSMGGMGTFEILRRKPDIFAAAFSICGGDNTNNARKYAKKVPLWLFHGAKDSVVPVEHSEAMVAALKEAGANPKFTVYPNDDHNSWNDAFAEPMLIPWLFSHSR